MRSSSDKIGFFDWLHRPRHVRIFICYRRHGDSAGYGGRLAERLINHFGADQCFRDVESIEAGVDFSITIKNAVNDSEVMIVVIGPDWLKQTNDRSQRRIDDPNDFVRIEVASALNKNIRVIPVLVGGASIPGDDELPDALKGLARRQAQELTDSRWEYDTGKLIEVLESMGFKPKPVAKGTTLWRSLIKGGVVVFIAVLIGLSVSELSTNMTMLPQREQHDAKSEIDKGYRERIAAKTPTHMEPETEILTREQPKMPPPQISKGVWHVSWSDSGGEYEGLLMLEGNSGKLQVRFFNPAIGQVMISQQLRVEHRATETVISGYDVRNAQTGLPIDPMAYSPDHAHLYRDASGVPHAKFCDPFHTCFTASIAPSQ